MDTITTRTEFDDGSAVAELVWRGFTLLGSIWRDALSEPWNYRPQDVVSKARLTAMAYSGYQEKQEGGSFTPLPPSNRRSLAGRHDSQLSI